MATHSYTTLETTLKSSTISSSLHVKVSNRPEHLPHMSQAGCVAAGQRSLGQYLRRSMGHSNLEDQRGVVPAQQRGKSRGSKPDDGISQMNPPHVESLVLTVGRPDIV